MAGVVDEVEIVSCPMKVCTRDATEFNIGVLVRVLQVGSFSLFHKIWLERACRQFSATNNPGVGSLTVDFTHTR